MTARERRVLLGGATVSVALLLAFRVLPAAGGWAIRARAEVRSKAELLARAQAELASVSSLEDSAVSIRGQLEGLAPMLLGGAAFEEASAALSARIAMTVSRSGAKLLGSDVTRDTVDAGALQSVAARVQVESDLKGILRAIHALESDTLAVAVTAVRIRGPDLQPAATAAEVLQAELMVRAWFVRPDTSHRGETR